MTWDEVIPAVLSELRGDSPQPVAWDPDKAVRAAQDSVALSIPSVTWFMVADTELELWNPILVQWDIYAASWAQAASIESWLRDWLHHDLPTTFGSVDVWSELVDVRTGDAPAGTNPGLVHRQLDVRFTALRSKYAAIT